MASKWIDDELHIKILNAVGRYGGYTLGYLIRFATWFLPYALWYGALTALIFVAFNGILLRYVKLVPLGIFDGIVLALLLRMVGETLFNREGLKLLRRKAKSLYE